MRTVEKNLIFITGMPRSGTTLVESIIGSNEDVFLEVRCPHYMTN